MSVIYRNGQKYAGMNLGAYQKKESEYVTQSGTTTTVPIGIDGYRSTDILLVDVNGLNLVEDTDYTISGTNIVLVTPITKAGESIHFVSLRTGSVESVDLSSLKGDKGDKGDAGVVDAYPRTGATPLSANWLSETSGGSALTPESDQIYILMADSGDYTANSMFRWNGSAYEPLTSGGSSGGGHVELTQAEYDELTQEEKENGEVYFITDGVPEYTIINDSVPIGAIQSYGGVSLPYGWLFCDGAAVSRETYSELFTAIGTTYGAGDGSTTFNLPDLRGRVLIGESSSYAIGSNGGEATHTLTVDEMPSHKHDRIEFYNNSEWTVGDNSGIGGTQADAHSRRFVSGYDAPASTAMSHWNTSSAGSSQAHNNMQPYLVGNYIIKALNTVSSSRLEELDPQQILFNMFYPVGSYYETSDATFDPNVQWRGTWVKNNVDEYTESKKLLWTNPNNNSFSPQTISLELQNYNSIEVLFTMWSGDKRLNANFLATKKNYSVMAHGLASANTQGSSSDTNLLPMLATPDPTERAFYFTDTGVVFGEAREGMNGFESTNNSLLIPHQIYGIKNNTNNRWHRTA